MTRSEERRYEMLLRLRDFGIAHQDRFPESSAGARAFAIIARITADIDSHLTAKAVAVREGRRVKMDRRHLMIDRMKVIIRTSKGVRTESGTPLRLRMPDRTSDIAILTAARGFLREVEPYQAQLLDFGFPEGYLAELRQTTDVFAEALAERRSGRSATAGLRAGIRALLVEGAGVARKLDIIVTNALGTDLMAMASWARDRKLVTGAPRRVRVTPAVSAPESTGSPSANVQAPDGGTSTSAR